MRTLPSFFVACLLWIIPIASQTKTDRERAELVGPVKSVEAYLVDYFLRDGKTEERNRRPWHSTTYNSDGNITKRISYDHTGKITAKYTHTYDAQGRSTGYEEYSDVLDKSLNTARRHVYVLDAEGRKIEYLVYESNGSVGTRFVYMYDVKGNVIEDRWYPHTGRLGRKSIHTFDEANNQTSQTAYDGDGAPIWRTISRYDERGNKTEWLQYEKDILRYKIDFRYDSKQRVVEEETFEFNAIPNNITSHAPKPGKVVYTYDDEKRTKEVSTYNPDGTLKGKVAYRYDERGNEIDQTMFNPDGSPKNIEIRFYDNIYEPGSQFRGTLRGRSLMEIEYDSYRNWTKKTRLIQSEKGGKPQPHNAEVREITYY